MKSEISKHENDIVLHGNDISMPQRENPDPRMILLRQ